MPLPPRRPHHPHASSPSSSSLPALGRHAGVKPTVPIHGSTMRLPGPPPPPPPSTIRGKPGFVVPRKTTRCFVATRAGREVERMEVELLDVDEGNAEGRDGVATATATATATARLSGLSLAAPMAGASDDGLDRREDKQVPLIELIEATRGKGHRGPRTALAQSLDYDVIPPHPPILALDPNGTDAVDAVAIHPSREMDPSDDVNQRPETAQAKSTSTSTSMLRALVGSFGLGLGLGRTPDLSRSSETVEGGSIANVPVVAAAQPNHSVSSEATAVGDWERVPSFDEDRRASESDPWVGIEDDTDETLVFWDDIDDDDALVGNKQRGHAEGGEQTLTYARVLRA